MFKPNEIIYDKDDFKVAEGTWTEEDGTQTESMGMRWANFPKSRFGWDAWLVLPEEIAEVVRNPISKLSS